MINYQPIAFFETEYSIKTGAPRQGMLNDDTKGVINLNEEYVQCLEYLSSFEYIWVICHFHESKGWKHKVNPPGSDHEFGLFATRSPRRPNPIGLSLIKLDSISGNKLYVSNVDAFDGTPVLDIKPYLPSIDNAVSIKNTEAEVYLGLRDKDF